MTDLQTAMPVVYAEIHAGNVKIYAYCIQFKGSLFCLKNDTHYPKSQAARIERCPIGISLYDLEGNSLYPKVDSYRQSNAHLCQ